MESPFDDDDLGPCSRGRSNTWPRLARAPEPSPPLAPCYPEHDVMPGAAPWPRGGMDVIVEDADDATAASATAVKTAAKPRNAWGNASYADLIAQAITSAPERRLTLAQIYRWMEENVPYFRSSSSAGGSSGGGGSGSSAGWKNSVRHNLSLLDRFVRVQNEDKGQSSWWTVDPDAKPGRGSRTRRRAASMEASKMTEQRRGRVLERVKSLRRAKQQQQDVPAVPEVVAVPPGPAGPATCSADQLASSLGQYMALGEGSRSGPGSAYLPQPLASMPSPGDSANVRGAPRRQQAQLTQQARYRQEVAAAAAGCYGDPRYGPTLLYTQQALVQAKPAPPSQRPPSPPLYQQLPTILQAASDQSSAPYELPTVLPAREVLPTSYPSPPFYRQPQPPRGCSSASDYSDYQTTPDPSPPLYRHPARGCNSASDYSDYQTTPDPSPHPSPPFYQPVYQPVYQPLRNLTQPTTAPLPSYQCQPQYGQQYEPPCDDLGLPFTVDGGLNCDVDAVLRQELILEGNLDFNFSQPTLTYGAPYVSQSLVI